MCPKCSLLDSGEFFSEEVSTPILDSVENPIHLKNLSLKVSFEAFTYFAFLVILKFTATHHRSISAGTETVI